MSRVNGFVLALSPVKCSTIREDFARKRSRYYELVESATRPAPSDAPGHQPLAAPTAHASVRFDRLAVQVAQSRQSRIGGIGLSLPDHFPSTCDNRRAHG
jgi:hypothetical protein